MPETVLGVEKKADDKLVKVYVLLSSHAGEVAHK